MPKLFADKSGYARLILCLILVAFPCTPSLLAQTISKTDSLLQLLPETSKEQRVDVLNALCKVYIGNDTAKALDYHTQARALAEQLNYGKGQAVSFNHLGTIYYFSSNYTADTSYQFRALRLFEQTGDKEGIARSYANIGLALYAQSQYADALEYHQKALMLRLQLGDRETIADSYTSIGIVYANQGDYTSALDYQLESLKIRELMKDKRAIALSNNYLGNIYKALKYYDKALECYIRALSLYEQIGEKLGTAIASNNVGGIYALRGENQRALKYYNKSLEVCNSLGNRYNRVVTYNYLGQVHQNMGEDVMARDYFSKALIESIQIGNKQSTAASYNNLGELDYKEKRYAASISNLLNAKRIAETAKLKDELSSAFLNLAKAYAATGNYQNAYDYHNKYSHLQDTLRNVDLKRISTLTTRALENKKNKELEIAAEREKKVEAEVKKQITIKYSFIGGSVLLLVFLVVLFNRFRVINRQKKIIESEQERSNSLLLNILPADVAEELKQNGKARARSYDTVTVLFADIQNFTKIGESLSPERLVSEIDFYFKAFDDIITRYGIEKIKTIGDAYMCATGLHNNGVGSATDMVHAALDLQSFMNNTRRERIGQKEIFFEIRIGIHTGPVVAGIVGLKKFAYDIWGDAVNTAARMETAGETNRINISEATHELVKEHFDCTYRGKMDVKNKGLMDMYFVDSVKTNTPKGYGDFTGMREYVLKELSEKLPPNLYYHGVHHTIDVLNVAELLSIQEQLSASETELIRAAALFHDSGFLTAYHQHEEASCTMTRATMPLFGYSQGIIDEVCTLILATKMPQTPKNHLERILCDADLDYLGRDDYDHISDNLFRELKEYGYSGDDDSWREKQMEFLGNHRYFLINTEARKAAKEKNLTKLQYPQANI
ncbi:MAG: adenylate/guanylate cyclase domain-containing protein [Bacteroidota bacterium]